MSDPFARRIGPDGEEWPRVEVTFTDFADPQEAADVYDRLMAALGAADLTLNDESVANTSVILDGAQTSIWAPFANPGVESLFIAISVDVYAGDDAAEQSLAPLVLALGTVD